MMEPVLIASPFGEQSTTTTPQLMAGKIKTKRATSLVVGNGGSTSLSENNLAPDTLHTSPATITTTTTSLATSSGVAASSSLSSSSSSGGGGGGTIATTTGIDTTIVSTVVATTPSTIKQNNSSNVGHQIPSDILDDLASRFIINVPDDERNNLIRICFQIELAHWFYLDFFCSIEEKKLVPCGIKQFATHLFHHIPFLRTHLSGIDKILEDWKEYKLSVPTYGAILMSEDLKYVLLVQSYWAKCSWGFPKGKVNEHEDPIHCATREVFEETGYDITGLIVPNDYIEGVINYQYTRLYLVRNVPIQTLFSPRTRKEIKCCEWFPVDSLPTNKNEITKTNLGINAHSFFMIKPFIKRLKKWVQDNRNGKSDSGTTVSGGVGTVSSTNIIMSSTTPLPNSSKISSTNFNNNNNNNNSRKGDSNKYNGNSALNINSSNGYKSNFGCNNNNNNNGGKRQRHKSMGDIDGIKINVTNNSNNNGSSTAKSFTGTKSFYQPLQTTPNNVNDSNNIEHVNFKREKYSKTNSKRQLFNSSSSNGNCNSGNIACNSCVNNISNNSDTIINCCNFDNKRGSNSSARINRSSTIATTTSSKVSNKYKSKPVSNIQSQKNSTTTTSSSTSSTTTTTTTTTSSSSSRQSSSTTTTTNVSSSHSSSSSSSSSRMSPTFESWTSFTFTKNFIANVFC